MKLYNLLFESVVDYKSLEWKKDKEASDFISFNSTDKKFNIKISKLYKISIAGLNDMYPTSAKNIEKTGFKLNSDTSLFKRSIFIRENNQSFRYLNSITVWSSYPDDHFIMFENNRFNKIESLEQIQETYPDFVFDVLIEDGVKF